jgi:hypothetical protein
MFSVDDLKSEEFGLDIIIIRGNNGFVLRNYNITHNII